MEGIAEANETGDAAASEKLIGAHARDAPTHRFAADQQRGVRRQLRPQLCDDLHIFLDEALGLWRRSSLARFTPRRHVGELKTMHGDAALGDKPRNRLEEGACHCRAGSVCEQEMVARGLRACGEDFAHEIRL
jgi:hypothetical protein